MTKPATGAADITAAGLAALLQARAEGAAPVKAIMSIYTMQPDAIFTASGGQITSLKSLEGRKMRPAPSPPPT